MPGSSKNKSLPHVRRDWDTEAEVRRTRLVLQELPVDTDVLDGMGLLF